MKKTLVLTCAAMIAAASAFAQNFEGVVKYSRVNDPSKMFANNSNRPANPQFSGFAEQARRPVLFELTVKGDQSLYKADPKQEAGESTIEIMGERRTFARRLPKDETLYDLKGGTFKKYEEYAQQPFQVSGKSEEIRWKVDPTQTRQVLGYECMMATASESEQKKVPSFQDGGLTVKDSLVTTQITAWFTDALTTSAGPDKYSGLPGLILALDVNDGVTTYVATNVEAKKVEEADFKINTKGKKVTPEQFKKLKDEHQAEQTKNFRGGIRIN